MSTAIATEVEPGSSKLLEHVSCPGCRHESYSVVSPSRIPANLTEDRLRSLYSSSSDHELFEQMVRCEQCQLMYLNPRVRGDLILEGYSDAVDPDFARQNEQRVRTFHRNLSGITRQTGLQPGEATRVLDVGSAGGAFLKAAADLGFHAIGVEPSRYLCDLGRELYDVDLRPGTLQDHSFDDASFQAVTLWDVIEHLTDPDQVINEIHRILEDEGILVINYPDIGSFASRTLGRKWPFLLSVHLTYFTRTTIRQFLQSRGFEVIEIKPFWQTLELAYVLQRAAQYFSVFSGAKWLIEKTGLAHLACTYNMGQTRVIARKRPQAHSST